MAVEVDRVGMFGTGSAAEPMGLYNESGVNEVATVGTPTNYDEILSGYKAVLDDNADGPTGLIYNPREWLTYAKLVDGEGRPQNLPPAIQDLQFEATSAVRTDLGGGADSAMFLGDFTQFAFAFRSELRIELLKELFAGTHEYGFACHLRMDTLCLHPESFCKLTGVTSA